MSKPINMATGGLMSMPPYIQKQEEKDEGITPYDVKTPESARKGLPARLLGKTRTRFSSGDAAFRNKIRPIDIPDELEEGPAEGDIPGEKYAGGKSAKDKLIIETINRLEAQKEITEDSATLAKIDNQIKSLESKVSTRITAALGGYMDENDIAEQTPLALNIGGAVGRRDERKDYQAYAEVDVV